jgi:hypothetical protein
MYPAQPPLEFIPPKYNPWFLHLTHLLLPLWMRSQTSLTEVEAENAEVLTDLYSQFQAGKIRFMMAFRHPKTDDPVALGYFFSQIMPKVARKQGIKLKTPIHAHFIYDRGIPLWAGSYIGWIAQNLTATPIQRGKADWTGLRSARDLFVNGTFPMAAAPEGATNGLSEIVNPLEPGIAQMGFWCAEDLQKAGRTEQVLILPVGIKYSYVEEPWDEISNLLTELEAKSGLSSVSPPINIKLPESDKDLFSHHYFRLLRVSEHLLAIIEKFYAKSYRCQLPIISNELTSDKNEVLSMRLQAVLNEILKVAEDYFVLQSKGTLSDRCRRIEQAGWNLIFREDFKDIESLSSVEKGLGDRVAEEANIHMWHMRLVESFVAVTGKYIREKPSAERFAETLLILWQMVVRIEGGNTSKRPYLGKQTAKIIIGKPISVSDKYAIYKTNRQSVRQAVADLTKDMQVSLESLI